LLNEVTLKENQRIEIDEFIDKISNEIKSIPQGKIRHVRYILFLFFILINLLQF
jgi:hypothetical protein